MELDGGDNRIVDDDVLRSKGKPFFVDFDHIGTGREGGGSVELTERISFHGTSGDAVGTDDLDNRVFDEFTGLVDNDASYEVGYFWRCG